MYWVMFSNKGCKQNSCLRISMSPWKMLCLRHLISFAVSLFCWYHWWNFLFTCVVKPVSYFAMDIQHAEISVPKYLSYYGVVSHHCIIISNIYQGYLMWWKWARNQLRCDSARVYTTRSLLKLGCERFIFIFLALMNSEIHHIWHQMHFLSHIPHMPIQAMQCNVYPTASYPMYMKILAQTIKLVIQFVCFYEWVFMYMYLRINIVAYWLLLYSAFIQNCRVEIWDMYFSQTQKFKVRI